jgi:hypothetical protein
METVGARLESDLEARKMRLKINYMWSSDSKYTSVWMKVLRRIGNIVRRV